MNEMLVTAIQFMIDILMLLSLYVFGWIVLNVYVLPWLRKSHHRYRVDEVD